MVKLAYQELSTRRWLLPLAAAAWVLGVVAPVAAEQRWLILPSSVASAGEGERDIARTVAAQLSRELDPPGASPVDPVRARDLYEQRGSTAPVMFSHSDLDALARDTQMALYHVASGLPARARRDVERALARADRVLESLNRESLAAQQLLDACLFLVRAHLQGGRRGAAREQALECRRLVPDIEPDGTTHPPDVIGLLAEAEAHLRINQPGALRVESDPGGCAVYVNGRRLGTAPLELAQLGPGEYRVQAECVEGQPGRVHRVQIGSTRVTLRIDTALDEAVHTESVLALRYSDRAAEREHGARHAVEVARAVGATHVAWVRSPDSGTVEVQLLRVADRALAASAPAAVRGGVLADLVALREALTSPSPTPGPVPVQVGAPPDPEAPVPRGADPGLDGPAPPASVVTGPVAAPSPRGEPRDGGDGWWMGTAIAGGAALAAGWTLWALQYADERRHAAAVADGDDYRRTLADVEGDEFTHVAVAGAGALAGAVALPMLDAEWTRSPWWAGSAGAVGLGLLGAGVALTAGGARCEAFDATPIGRCTDSVANSRLGPLLLVTSLPVLSVPVAYLLRSDATGGMAVGVRPRAHGGALLTLSGSL